MIWAGEDWFICWELKVDASEGEDQTPDYVDADSFSSIDLDKDDVPGDEHHYIYLAPEQADPAEADEFVHISWEWIADQIQSYVAQSDGIHPTRTTAQMNDFASTIRSELTVTEYQESQDEKVELYLDHYEEIREVQTAFDEKWRSFTSTWGDLLADGLEEAIVLDDPEVPDEYVAVDIELEDGVTRRWTFRQGHSDWAWIFPREWWRNLDEDEPIYDTVSPMARVGFLHRLDWNRDEAIRARELIFYLRNAPTADDDFHDGFAERFNNDPTIPSLLPGHTERTGNKANVLKSTYDINTEYHDDFFEAYIAALTRGMEDHVVQNPGLVNKIDGIYEQTNVNDTGF